MELNGMTGRLFKICEVISKLAYVNLLWILFTLLGLGIFGVMPATIALFAVNRKWIMGERDIPVFTTFYKVFRQEFFKSTYLGVILFAIGYILYIDLAYLPTGGILSVLRWGLIICSLLYIIMLLYILPIYVHYEWKKRLYIKYAFLLGASHPHYTLLMIIGIVVLYYIMITVPGLIPFFSVSILSYIVSWIAFQVLMKIEAGHESGGEQTVEGQVLEPE